MALLTVKETAEILGISRQATPHISRSITAAVHNSLSIVLRARVMELYSVRSSWQRCKSLKGGALSYIANKLGAHWRHR